MHFTWIISKENVMNVGPSPKPNWFCMNYNCLELWKLHSCLLKKIWKTKNLFEIKKKKVKDSLPKEKMAANVFIKNGLLVTQNPKERRKLNCEIKIIWKLEWN